MNKMNKKKGIAILVSLMLVFSLAACTETAQTQAGSAGAVSNVSDSAASDVTAFNTTALASPTSDSALPQEKIASVPSGSTATQQKATKSINISASAPSEISNCPKTKTANSPSASSSSPAQTCVNSNAELTALYNQLSKNGNACSLLKGGKISCNTSFCGTQICSRISCEPSDCLTAACKANSCKSKSGGQSASKPSPSGAGTVKTPAGSTSSGTANTDSSIANQVLKRINAERAKNGAAPLAMNTNAQKAAQLRANEIVQQFSHTRPNGQSCFTALKQFNVSYSTAGENIAYGQPDAQTVVNGWMNSPGHRANILNGNFKQTGIGVYRDSKGTYYWTQLFIG